MELQRIQNQINLLQKAYTTLETACNKTNLSDLESDGLIQRFEYTIELTWKTGKKYLEYKGLQASDFPKDIFKTLFSAQIVPDLEVFFEFLETRNTLSHMYSEHIAHKDIHIIKEHHTLIQKYISNLQNNI